MIPRRGGARPRRPDLVVVGTLATALFALAAAGRARADVPAAAAPRIAVEPPAFDFGAVRAARSVNKEFLIRNFGTAELVIQSLTTSCGCTAALMESKTVKPGGSTTLRVTLTAVGGPGRLAKSVLVKSNDPEHPAVEVKIEATVVARPRAASR